jgi:hypothetical protein
MPREGSEVVKEHVPELLQPNFNQTNVMGYKVQSKICNDKMCNKFAFTNSQN